MKATLLTFLITAISCFCFADTNVVQTPKTTFVMSNLVLTVVNTNSPGPTEEEYVGAAQDYEQHPEHYRIDQLFGVARGFMAEGKYSQAIPLYKKSLTVQPTNTVCIREIGLAYLKLQKYNEAASQFKQGWKLGDDVALKDLANLYLMFDRLSDIKPLVPDLLKARDRMTDKNDKHEITNVLVYYSLNAESSADKGIFLKAMDGLSDQFILEREDTAQVVIMGLKAFGYQERADKLAAEMKKAK
jgi:tetratricopeptide (TPR) repeat protein